jgi:DNA-binding NarL/FixJ family response regulator
VIELTPSEVAFIDSVSRHGPYTAVAEATGMPLQSVKNRAAEITRKLGVQRMSQVVRIACEAGLLEPLDDNVLTAR